MTCSPRYWISFIFLMTAARSIKSAYVESTTITDLIQCKHHEAAAGMAFVSSRRSRILTNKFNNYQRVDIQEIGHCVGSNSYPSLLSIRNQRYSASIPKSSSRCHYRREDSFVSGIAEISMGFSLGVLWSEYYIISTGCGPPNFSDTLERICYQGVIVSAGIALFNRIVRGGRKDLATTCQEFFEIIDLEEFTLQQVRVAEWMSFMASIGAFIALGFQYANGVNMDGLSGIDVDMCRAIRDI